MPDTKTRKKGQKVQRELEKATKEMLKATEHYLHATIELAQLGGAKTWKKVRPHVVSLAKNAEKFHKKVVRG